MGQVKLVYKGTASFSNQDAKMIITRATKGLSDVFENEGTNKTLLLTFTSSETFLERESKAVQKKIDDPVDFAVTFCDLLKQRPDVVGALNQLLNLTDPHLRVYEKNIRTVFKRILPMELVLEDVPDLNLPNMIDVPDLGVPGYEMMSE